MWVIGPVGFTAPWVLAALAVLPILWWLMRAAPPRPVEIRFPAAVLIKDLKDAQPLRSKTPWWLILLRSLALIALIAAFAGPVWRPTLDPTPKSEGALLVVFDASWASARDWEERLELVRGRLRLHQGPAAIVQLTAPTAPLFETAAQTLERLRTLVPNPWEPQPADWAKLLGEARFDSLWISDGLARADRANLGRYLAQHGEIQVIEPPAPLHAIRNIEPVAAGLRLQLARPSGGPQTKLGLQAIGTDPAGYSRSLQTRQITWPAGERELEVDFALPPQLRNRITRVQIVGESHAGGTYLAANGLKRPIAGLLTRPGASASSELLDPMHYVREALRPGAELLEATLDKLIAAPADIIIAADSIIPDGPQASALSDWINEGGVLLRFAGPRMAQSGAGDGFLPVAIRQGGRTMGSAMSWARPKGLADFNDSSLFAGLSVPGDIEVNTQLLAEPGADLAQYVLARLDDGTPLVTRRARGQGAVILFHVTATPAWSTLPLSELYIQMLARITQGLAMSGAPSGDGAGSGPWRLDAALDAFGRLDDTPAPVTVPHDGTNGPVHAAFPPGIYGAVEQAMAVNVLKGRAPLAPADWPEGITPQTGDAMGALDLRGGLLTAGVLLICADLLASLAAAGRLLLILGVMFAPVIYPGESRAQGAEQTALGATKGLALAYVATGDPDIDEISRAGLQGLSRVLARRTTVKVAQIDEVNPDVDELAFYPLLYWPVTADQKLPGATGLRRLRGYLAAGGMILFDTRNGDLQSSAISGPENARLRAIARPIGVPELAILDADHVLTRSFYLLADTPGRHQGPVWVARRTLGDAMGNDGVSPVVLGGNDWAAAWAIDAAGQPLLPVGFGASAERQREIAYRFGVNLVLYALTGNYKADQVHIPLILEKLEARK